MKYFKFFALFFFAISILLSVFREWDYDEAWSYLYNIGSSAWQVWEYANFKFANNHVINSLYIHFMQVAAVKHVFFYRLASLASFVVYSVYYHKYIVYRTKNRPAQEMSKISFIFICLVPFLFPFFTYFSMARGYSIAVATFMAAVYFFTRLYNTYSLKDIIFFTFFSLISSVSIFSFIFPFAAMGLFIVVKNFAGIKAGLRSAKSVTAYLAIILLTGLTAYYIYGKGLIITWYDPNIAGGDFLFKNGLFSSIFSFLALQNYIHSVTLFIIMRDCIAVTLVISLVVFYKNSRIPPEHILFAATIAMIIVSHVLFKSKYPNGRALSYLLLLLYLPMLTLNIKRSGEQAAYYGHFLTLVVIGLYSTGAQLKMAFSKNSKDALTYMSANFPGTPIFFNLNDPDIDVYNMLYFQKKLTIINDVSPIGNIVAANHDKVFLMVSPNDSSNSYAAHGLTNTGYLYSKNSAIFVYKPQRP